MNQFDDVWIGNLCKIYKRRDFCHDPNKIIYMKKIIFLDFDGVLNTEHNQNMLLYKGKAWKDKHGAFFDLKAVAN